MLPDSQAVTAEEPQASTSTQLAQIIDFKFLDFEPALWLLPVAMASNLMLYCSLTLRSAQPFVLWLMVECQQDGSSSLSPRTTKRGNLQPRMVMECLSSGVFWRDITIINTSHSIAAPWHDEHARLGYGTRSFDTHRTKWNKFKNVAWKKLLQMIKCW